jgi:hypothetical protein
VNGGLVPISTKSAVAVLALRRPAVGCCTPACGANELIAKAGILLLGSTYQPVDGHHSDQARQAFLSRELTLAASMAASALIGSST